MAFSFHEEIAYVTKGITMAALTQLGVNPYTCLLAVGTAPAPAGDGAFYLFRGISEIKDLYKKLENSLRKAISIALREELHIHSRDLVKEISASIFTADNLHVIAETNNDAGMALITQLKEAIGKGMPTELSKFNMFSFARKLVFGLREAIQDMPVLYAMAAHFTARELHACYRLAKSVREVSFQALEQELSETQKALEYQPIHISLQYIDKMRSISEQQKRNACRYFYKVTNDIQQISRVVCNDLNIMQDSFLHKALPLVQYAQTTVLTGVGGIGKTTLLFRLATEFAKGLCPVFFLRLKTTVPAHRPDDVRALLSYMNAVADSYGKRAILFIDNPCADIPFLETLCALQGDYGLQIVLAERVNRLRPLFTDDAPVYKAWHDDAFFLCFTTADDHMFSWVDENKRFIHFLDQDWKSAIIQRMILVLVEHYQGDPRTLQEIVRTLPDGIKTASIVETIYYIAMRFNRSLHFKGIQLDWDVWNGMVKKAFGNSAQEATFGCLAALNLFRIPITPVILSKVLHCSKREAARFIRTFFHGKEEPIVTVKDRVFLKHDAVADAYYRLECASNPKAAEEDLVGLIPIMDEETALAFEKVCLTKRCATGKSHLPLQISCRSVMLAMEGSESFLSHLERNGRLYAYDLVRFWHAQSDGDYEALSGIIRYLKEQYPQNPRVQRALGEYFASEKRYQEAEETFLHALQSDPYHLSMLHELACLYARSKRYADAEATFLRALQVDENNLPALTELARLYASTNRPEEAEATIRHALQVDADDLMALTELARLYAKTNRPADAESIFLYALQVDRNCLPVLNELARLYSKANRLKEAEEIFLRALETDKDNVHALTELARLFVKTNRTKEAEAILLHVLEIDRDSVHSLNELAQLYLKMGRRTEQESMLLRLLKIKPHDSRALDSLARFYRRNERFEEAVGIYRKMIDINRNDSWAVSGLFYAYYDARDYRNAKDVLAPYRPFTDIYLHRCWDKLPADYRS